MASGVGYVPTGAESGAGPLAGIRVLEVGDRVSAAYAGKLFVRGGAEVIAVSAPATADDDAAREPQAVALDRYLNGGKRRVAIDYHGDEGRALLRRLAAQCDIVVSDLLPAEAGALELDAVHSGRTRVRAFITPFGMSGPYRDYAATSATLLALGGYTFLMGDAGRAPLTMPGHYVEYQVGTIAYTHALACLYGSTDLPARRSLTRGVAPASAPDQSVTSRDLLAGASPAAAQPTGATDLPARRSLTRGVAPASAPDLSAREHELLAEARLASGLDPDAHAPAAIEISEFECLVALHQFTTVQYSYAGTIRARHGNRWDNNHPLTILPCVDGWYGCCIVQPFWAPFALWLGHPDWITDPRYATGRARFEHADELDALIRLAMGDRSKHQIQVEGQGVARVPIGAVLTIADILEDEHLAARAFWQTVPSDGGGPPLRYPSAPIRFNDAPLPLEQAAAPAGAHSAEVLAELAPAHDSGARVAGARRIG